jgi:hypothetical protein
MICDPSKCPIPMCQLPEVLDARQIRTLMEYLDIPSKEIAVEFNLQHTQVWAVLNRSNKYQNYLRPISDYVKKKLIEESVKK